MPQKNALGLERSGPRGKPSGFCPGAIARDSENDREKSRSRHTAEPGRFGALSYLQAHQYLGVLGLPSSPPSGGNGKRGADRRKGSDRWTPAARPSRPEVSPGALVTHSKPLAQEEPEFFELKSSREVSPVDPCWGRRPQSAIRPGSFPWSPGSSPGSQAQWMSKGFHGRNPPQCFVAFTRSDVARLSPEANFRGACFAKYLKKETELLQKLGLLPLFSHGPKWIRETGPNHSPTRLRSFTFKQCQS